MASTTPRTKVVLRSENGNPFKALGVALHQADLDAAARLRRSRPARQANAKRAAAKKAAAS